MKQSLILIWDLPEISVLRDDVITCLEKLKTGYNKKSELLNLLALNETESIEHVVSGNTDSLEESLKKSDDIILLIQSLDFDIASIYDELSLIMGVKRHEIISTITKADKENSALLKNSMQACEKSMTNVYDKNSELITKMENSMNEINKDILELMSTRKAMKIIDR